MIRIGFPLITSKFMVSKARSAAREKRISVKDIKRYLPPSQEQITPELSR